MSSRGEGGRAVRGLAQGTATPMSHSRGLIKKLILLAGMIATGIWVIGLISILLPTT